MVLTTFASWEQLQHANCNLTFSPIRRRTSRRKWRPQRKHASRDPIRPGNGLLQFRRARKFAPSIFRSIWDDSANVITRKCYLRASASPEDKISLYTALTSRTKPVKTLLVSTADVPEKQLPRPSLFSQILLALDEGKRAIYLDPDLEVAPCGMIRPDLRGKKALELGSNCTGESCWMKISGELPFSSTQRVSVDATISAEGTLDAKVKYTMRGDNEFLLRMAFHQSPRDKWKEVAQLMSFSDGFRGKIVSTSASDPVATKNPSPSSTKFRSPNLSIGPKNPCAFPRLFRS